MWAHTLPVADQHHRVSIASTGPEALHLSQQQRFDLILMDMHLPGLSGLEVCEQIQQDPQNPNHQRPIIALTASVRDEDRARYQQAGLEDVIAKPVHKHELLSTLQQHAPPAAAPASNSLLAQHRQHLGHKKVQQLLENLAALLEQEWPQLKTSIEESNTHRRAEQAHRLAGACEMLGFREAGALLRTLEDRSLTLTPALEEQLETEMKQLQQHIRRQLDRY